MRRLAVSSAIAVVAIAGVPASAAVAAGTSWQATDLGTLGGFCCSTATGINDRGEVVGYSDAGTTPAYNHAFLWRNGRMTDLGTLGANSFATAVNNRSEVVGYSEVSSGVLHAFLWHNGRMADLGTLGGDYSAATSINDRGEIVGHRTVPGGGLHAFVWRAGVMADLGTLNGGFARAYDINNSGQIVGESSVDGMNSVPVLWQDGRLQVLDTRYGVANAINNRGEIAGYYYVGGGFVWRHGRITVLDPSPGTMFAQVNGVNDRGQVVGATDSGAFVWQDGSLTPLPNLGGSAVASASTNRAVSLAVPTPLPTAIRPPYSGLTEKATHREKGRPVGRPFSGHAG
jgi:probable HAF family extracellular repeat protein